MPELPEVHTVITELTRRGIVGRRIESARVAWARSVSGSEGSFSSRVAGTRIHSISRRGKIIVITLDGDATILVHLRMSGMLYPAAAGDPDRYVRVSMTLDDERELRFRDPRKFGRCVLTYSPRSVLSRLGPEPLSRELDPDRLYQILQARRRMLKPLLLDQTVVSGLGNIYTDEALWHARVHPQRRSNTLSPAEARSLLNAIETVLRTGIANNGTSLGSGEGNYLLPGNGTGPRNQEYLKVFQKTGEPCPRCGGIISRIVVGQRGTHVCEACQR